jgi:elongation factor Ts
MAAITAAMVKELRERTQSGMSDCKNALVQAEGDMAKAVEILQKMGKTKGEKAAGKVAAEGSVTARVNGHVGVVVELNCQTDFVARGEEFKAALRDLSHAAIEHKPTDKAALEAIAFSGMTFKDRIEGLTIRSGEKHDVRRVAVIEGGVGSHLHTYVHSNDRIAVLVEVASSDPKSPKVVEFADDVCLQVASMSPKYLDRAEVPEADIAKQREIFSALMDKEDAEAIAAPADFLTRVQSIVTEVAAEESRELGDMDAEVKAHFEKSEKDRATHEGFKKAAEKAKGRAPAAKEKILDGKIAKWLTEIVLLDQNSVKENNSPISKVMANVAKEVAGTKIVRFVRFEVGEGIEKAATKDFATEVAEMAAASAKG